jgi:hypothetical protein
MVLSQNKKEAGRFCCANGCNNKPVAKLGGLCHKHYQRKRRKEDPVGVRYTQFKANARNRNIENSVTLEEFRRFCEINQYIVKKGRRGQNATIDRRCNIHGYHIWNMAILTNRQNASKGAGFSGENFDCPF